MILSHKSHEVAVLHLKVRLIARMHNPICCLGSSDLPKNLMDVVVDHILVKIMMRRGQLLTPEVFDHAPLMLDWIEPAGELRHEHEL